MKHVYLLIFVSLLALTEKVLMQKDCPPGFIISGRKCVDEDECEEEDQICGDHADCTNTYGSYYCHCKKGFKPTGNFTQDNAKKCQDINECSEYRIDCGPNATCENTVGNYSCICETGYYPNNNAETFIVGQGVQCIDRNECKDSDSCGMNARCHNTPGSYYCTCAPGFRLRSGQTNFTDPKTDRCDTDICYTDTSICGEGSCINSKDGHECVCKSGFTNYGHKQMKCTDRDECEDSGLCGMNTRCHNIPGSYYCTCAPGFRLRSGQTNFTDPNTDRCETDICYTDTSICGEGSCINSKDGHECVCKSGFTNYGHKQMKCTDRDECEDSGFCGMNTRCHNIPGSYYCTCAPGFRLRSGQTNFTDPKTDRCETDICYTDKSICGEGSCKNGKDGHECVCKSGFTNYGHKQMKCTELKCDTFNHTLSQHPELTNIVSLMTNNCLLLSGKKEHFTQVDGEGFLKAFLDALDDLLRDGFKDNSADKITRMFDLVEGMLKLIGSVLNNNQTKRSTTMTEVELLVRRGVSPPDGPLMMSTDRANFTSNWTTATGNAYLGFTTAALLGYKNLEESLNSYFAHLKKQENIKYKINSKVVTVVVSNAKTKHLQEPVTLKFSHLKDTNENHTCVFWDHELEGGAWSTRNCTTVESNAVETVCSCTHLSSFAVLMALYDIGDVYELHVITCVGLSVSLICLLICIATFYLVRSIQCTRNTIHLHLCITLFIAYFIFLVGITRTENKVGCAVVAGMLHYFFLSAFCWMCLEGVQLFRMVVLVFNTTVRHIYLVAAGYGVPAVIVAVSAAVNADGYGTKQHCWLNFEDGSIWSFYGPVCVIIIVNAFFFLITIWKLAEKFSSLNPDLNNLRKIRTFTITAIAQLCVLGIMWVFGCFQFDKDTLAISYIFTILCSLQGVMMFVIHCCLSKQVRDEYVKFLACICTPQKRKYSEFNSNPTSKSQGSKSVQNTGESSI